MPLGPSDLPSPSRPTVGTPSPSQKLGWPGLPQSLMLLTQGHGPTRPDPALSVARKDQASWSWGGRNGEGVSATLRPEGPLASQLSISLKKTKSISCETLFSLFLVSAICRRSGFPARPGSPAVLLPTQGPGAGSRCDALLKKRVFAQFSCSVQPQGGLGGVDGPPWAVSGPGRTKTRARGAFSEPQPAPQAQSTWE